MLLLFVVVCRMTNFAAVVHCVFPVLSFSSSKQHLLLMHVPLGSTVAFAASIYLYYVSSILGNYGHARSQGGRQPAAVRPPFYIHTAINNYS